MKSTKLAILTALLLSVGSSALALADGPSAALPNSGVVQKHGEERKEEKRMERKLAKKKARKLRKERREHARREARREHFRKS